MNVIKEVKKELKNEVDLEYKKGCTNFFREDINILGVRTPKVREIGVKYYNQIKKKIVRNYNRLPQNLLLVIHRTEQHIKNQQTA